MANEQAKVEKQTNPQTGSAKLVPDLNKTKGGGKQGAQQLSDISQSSDIFHSVLLEVGYKSTGKIVPNILA